MARASGNVAVRTNSLTAPSREESVLVKAAGESRSSWRVKGSSPQRADSRASWSRARARAFAP